MEKILEMLEFWNLAIWVLFLMVVLRLFEKIRQKKLWYDNFEFWIYKWYYRYYMNILNWDDKISGDFAKDKTNTFIIEFKNESK